VYVIKSCLKNFKKDDIVYINFHLEYGLGEIM